MIDISDWKVLGMFVLFLSVHIVTYRLGFNAGREAGRKEKGKRD